MDTVRINGVAVEAEEFAWDGCHKIYLIQNADGRANVAGYDLYPLSRLAWAWERSCGLRFIAPADLAGPDIIDQCYEGEVHIDA